MGTDNEGSDEREHIREAFATERREAVEALESRIESDWLAPLGEAFRTMRLWEVMHLAPVSTDSRALDGAERVARPAGAGT